MSSNSNAQNVSNIGVTSKTSAAPSEFDHYILTHAKCHVRHHRWVCGNFSVDVGRYIFPTHALGAFPRDSLCLGYMRSLTAPTWVNGFEFGSDAIQFYPAGSAS